MNIRVLVATALGLLLSACSSSGESGSQAGLAPFVPDATGGANNTAFATAETADRPASPPMNTGGSGGATKGATSGGAAGSETVEPATTSGGSAGASNTTQVAPNDAPPGSPVAFNGQLRASGNHIVGEHGDPVQLKGMSLYWSQRDEGARYFKKETIDWLVADWRVSIVRAAIAVTGNGDGDYLSAPDAQLQLLDNVVQAAIDNGIYVLVDWHDHHANEHQAQAEEFFETVASRYGSEPNVLYEIWNEPRGAGDSGPGATWAGDIKPYAEAISAVLRGNGSDNLMIVGTPSWDQRPHEVIGSEVDDPNVAYSLHFYAGSDWHYFGTGGAQISQNAETALGAGLPLFVTEWGTTSHDNTSFNEGETRTWLGFLDEHHISHCNWSITAIEEGSAAIYPIASPDGNWSDSDLSQSGQLVRNLIRGD